MSSRTYSIAVAAALIAAGAGSLLARPGAKQFTGIGAIAGQRAAPAVGTGVIVGRAVEATSGRALAGVTVMLAQVPAGLDPNTGSGDSIPMDQLLSFDITSIFSGMHQVLTDSQGRFAFTGVPKGSFALTATKPGFTNSEYGQLRPDGSSSALTIGDGDRLADVTLRLWKLGSLAGTVVDEAGDPIIGLSVRAMRRTWVAGHPRDVSAGSAQTDDRGSYRIGGLTPGDYVVVITQTPVTLPAAGAAPALDPAALQSLIASAGRGGDPNAMMANFMSLASLGPGSGLRVGDWMLQVGGTGALPPNLTPDGRMFAYQTTFYPGATTSAQGAVFTLGSGEEHPGIDFQLRPVPVFKITGTLSGAPANIIGGATLRLAPGGRDDGVDGEETATATTDARGGFAFLAVPPGQYVVRMTRVPPSQAGGRMGLPELAMIQNASGGFAAMSSGPLTMASLLPVPPPIPTEPTLWASVPVSVGNADFEGVSIALRPGFRVEGRAEFNGSSPKPTSDQLRRMPIQLERADASNGAPLAMAMAGGSGQFDANGQFTTYGVVPGKYFIRVPFSMGGWVLKSATVAGRDAADVPLDIEGGDITGVVLTFTDQVAEISGTIKTGRGTPDPGASVLLFPTDPARWVDFGPSPRRLRTDHAGRDGRYRISSVPAGEYFIAVMGDQSDGRWQDPRFLETMSRSALRVTIADGEKKTQDLTSGPGR